MVLVMLLSTVVDFIAAQIIARGNRKFGLWLSIIVNIGLLGFFKYFNFTFENFYTAVKFFGWDHQAFHNVPHISLPIGISFYTFQTLSYTIDVYRGHVKANNNFIDFAAYVTVFPQLIAGPIVRYIDVAEQLKHKNISVDNFAMGVRRFIIGLSKKMIIANTCAALADSVFETPLSELSTGWAWLGVIAYSFQIFFDFSAYSDMAIGLGKMLGFDFMENFNYPYIAKSLREFWQRWHISLSTWFRDYLYIPLGGNRGSSGKVYRNLFIVFFITGLWHGASWNFIVWGLFHGLFLALERAGLNKLLEKMWQPLQHVYTLSIVLIGWVFFRAEDLTQSLIYLSKMFSITNGDPARISYLTFFYWKAEYMIMGFIAILWSTPMFAKAYSRMIEAQTKPVPQLIEMAFLLALFVISASYIAADTYNPFIYFRF